MKKILALIAISLITIGANAQFTTPWLPIPLDRGAWLPNYDDATGVSPYLNNEWGKAVVKFSNGLIYKNVDVKFDEVLQRLLFKTNEGGAVMLSRRVKEFWIDYAINGITQQKYFRTGYKNGRDYYEVLTDGGIQLLKHTAKVVTEQRQFPYGTGITKIIESQNDYYLYKNNKLIHLNTDESAVLAAIGSNQNELYNYIRNNKLNLKDDSDLAKLILYYNSM